MDWYSSGDSDVACASVSVRSGRSSDILYGSLLSFLSGTGDCADGDCTEDESGVCTVLDNRVFFSAGWAAFGGRPGPRFSPVEASCVCAMIYDGSPYRSSIVVG